MIEKRIVFSYQNGSNDFVNYIKGIAILFVILTHSLYPIKDDMLFNLWGMQAVPLFLIVSSALYFRKGVPSKIDFHVKKLFQRIILPYVVFSIILAIISIIIGKDTMSSTIAIWSKDAGMGPGSYYVPLYIQYFLLLPLFALLIKKTRHPFFILMVISVCGEILVNHYLPMWIYRLCIVRYLPLLYAGYYWASNGIVINNRTLALSLISAVAVVVLTYSGFRFNPIFCTFHPWEYANWICYCYPTFLLPYILYVFYKRNSNCVNKFFERLGKDSFEIYMMQMAVFYFFPIEYFQDKFSGSPNIIIYLICLVSTLIASIIPVLIYKKNKARLLA